MIPRIIAGHRRSFAALLIGLATWGACAAGGWRPDGSGWSRIILAWDVAAVAFLAMSFHLFAIRTPDEMDEDAQRQQDGSWTIFSVTLLGAALSFVALIGEFSGLKEADPAQRDLRVGLVVATLLLSWSMTHMLFAFRYAHDFYSRVQGKLRGGLIFPSEDEPDYWDFLYFAVVIGMTFQVSDVNISARRLRRLALLHGLLSFLFNTVIVALTVNIAAGLL